MNKAYFLNLLKYDHWANLEVLEGLKKAAVLPEKSMGWIAHIIAAEQIWHARILGEDWQKFAVWPERSFLECENLIETVWQNWQNYLNSAAESDLSGKIYYQNSKGDSYESVISDVLTHVTIHSGYHRGQIAAALRAAGEMPVLTDYIHFMR